MHALELLSLFQRIDNGDLSVDFDYATYRGDRIESMDLRYDRKRSDPYGGFLKLEATEIVRLSINGVDILRPNLSDIVIHFKTGETTARCGHKP